MDEKEFYNVKETAKILGLSPDRIYEYLRSGHLCGTRLTKHSKWLIPASEIEQRKRPSLEKPGAPLETTPGKWPDTIHMAAQLQNSVSHVGPKDWAIWGLPDTGQPPLTSEAGLRIWMDRGKLVVKLAVEQDNGFASFLTRLKTLSPELKSYDQWRETVTDLVAMCWDLAHEIWRKAENETGLVLGPVPVMGKGHLLSVPQFVYEFALNNYGAGKQPSLEILQNDAYRHRLVPVDLPNYILAIGSEGEMEMCMKVTVSLTDQYTKDKRIGEINVRAQQVTEQASPLQSALSNITKEAAADS